MYPYRLNYDSTGDISYEAEEMSPPGGPRQRPDYRPPDPVRPPRPDNRPPDPGPRPPRRGGRPPEPQPPFEPVDRPGFLPGEPPGFTPERYQTSAPGLRAVDPGSIRGCAYKYTYVWLMNGMSFWMYITFVGRQSVSGYRWTRFGWMYTGLDLQTVESFSCPGF